MIDIGQFYIVNYCHRSCEPLKNIMRLPKEEAFQKAYELAQKNRETTAFYRFADFENYYPRRLETDRILYERFVALGGKPKTMHPLSFVLQGSEYLRNWFNNGITIRIPLNKIPADCISFVYGDSMAVLRREGTFEMFTKDELMERINGFDGTVSEFVENLKKGMHYIEAQLWDDKYCEFAERYGK